ncbi:hypothetical protein FOA52_007830 [Chlamydomonas sp. UWO 241]|nr:hypothetical protein FOA52_007830 [Chlamydomonas sp. UWO 241]
MAVPMPGGHGLTVEQLQAPDLTKIRDALMARFGTVELSVDAAGRTGGAAPTASGPRSRKAAAAAPSGQHSALRQRITVVAGTTAGTADLRDALFRATVVELAHA